MKGWLLELDYARETWRFATGGAGEEVVVDGATYLGGLEVGEVILEAGLFQAQTETPGAAVTLGHWPADVPLSRMVGSGRSLWGASARLYAYGDNGRREVLIGKVKDPDIGDPGQAHTFTLEASSYEDRAQLPGLRQVITETTFPDHHESASGLSYPIPFGQPGFYIDADGNERRTAGSPAPVVEWREPPSVAEDTAYESVRVCAPWLLLLGSLLGTSSTEYTLEGSADAGPVIDGVQLKAGDRVLCPYQGNAPYDYFGRDAMDLHPQNGIYQLARDDTGGTSVWRLVPPEDYHTVSDQDATKQVYVEEGELFGGRWFEVVEQSTTLGSSFNWLSVGGSSNSLTRYETRWGLVAAYGAQRLIASGEEVEATRLRVFSDAEIREGELEVDTGNFGSVPLEVATDGAGQRVVLADLTNLVRAVVVTSAGAPPTAPVYSTSGASTTGANPYKWRMGTRYHLSWDEGRALMRSDRPQPVVHAGHVLEWVLGRSTLDVDRRRMVSVLDRLSAFQLDGYIDEPAKPLEIVSARWLNMLPMALRQGSRGLRIDVAQLGDRARVFLEVGRNCHRSERWREQFLRREGPLNQIRVNFARSIKRKTYKQSVLLGPDVEAAGELDSLPAEVSDSRYGVSSEVLEDPDVYAWSTAVEWASWRLRVYALPVLRAMLWVPDLSASDEVEVLGVPIQITDDTWGLTERSGMVDEVRVPANGQGLLLGVIVWDDSAA